MKQCIAVICLVLGLFVGYTSFGHQDTYKHIQTVEIEHGDTMWSIASRVTPDDMDIREVIYEIEEMNHITNVGALKPGAQIQVPVYKHAQL